MWCGRSIDSGEMQLTKTNFKLQLMVALAMATVPAGAALAETYTAQCVSVVDGDTLAEIGRLRIAAWEADGSRPAFAPASDDSWIDPHDEHAHHWVIRWRDTIVASARMCIHSTLQEMPDCECLVGLEGAILLAAASLNRLVVHPSFRGMHLGPRFDQVRIAKAKQLGAAGTFGTTHAKGRLRDLNDAGFVLLAESPHRIVPQLPSFVLWKGFNSSEDLK